MGVARCGQKTLKKAKVIGFLAQLLGIFISKWKPVTYVILCVGLHHWWKFCKNGTWFGVVMAQKPPKSSHKSPFLLVPETFQLYNLRTVEANRRGYVDETWHDCVSSWDFMIWVPRLGRGRMWPKNLPKTTKSWLLSLKIGISPRNFNTVFLSLRSTSGASFSKIGAILGQLGPKMPPKWPNSWLLHGPKNIWKFITWEPQMLSRWNLARLCIFMRPFIWQKI